MTQEQIVKLIELLGKISENMSMGSYTITGAADWPLLVVVGGGTITLLAFMWLDLRSNIRDTRGEWRDTLAAHKAENEKAHDLIWKAHNECQAECCPRRKE